jgi:dihydrofolate reductase
MQDTHPRILDMTVHARTSPHHLIAQARMSAQLTLVVALDLDRGIGIDNQMPWHLPQDLAHFKRVTLGKPVIMGRKTFDSIGRPLSGRRNIVVTRNAGWTHDGAERAASLEAAIALLDGAPASIIGGAQIFEASIGLADVLIVTHIAHRFTCDTFFPPIDPAVWVETARESHHADEQDFDYAYVTYERSSNQHTGNQRSSKDTQ